MLSLARRSPCRRTADRFLRRNPSCLFTALALLLLPSQPPSSAAQSLRHTVAAALAADPDTWSEPILGLPPAAYISTILKPSSWGGAIELAVLANEFGVEICSVDVQSGRVDRFGAGEGRVWVVYSGIRELIMRGGVIGMRAANETRRRTACELDG